MVAATPDMLSHAARCARRDGQFALAAHYDQKLVEEFGHEAWAQADITRLSTLGSVAGAPAQVTSQLLEFLRNSISKDACSYMAYMLFAEYFTVLVGDELIRHLVERCGIPVDAMTCVAKHVDIDRDHTDEGLDAIDTLVTEPSSINALRGVLQMSFMYFDQLGQELVEETVDERDAQLPIAV
jgi:hypothetical protein